MHGVLVVGGLARLPSEQCCSTIEQGIELTVAHVAVNSSGDVLSLHPYAAGLGSSTLLEALKGRDRHKNSSFIVILFLGDNFSLLKYIS